MSVCFLYVTVPNVAAGKAIARAVLAEKLVACANILPEMISMYEWQGELREEQEAVLILKTTAAQVESAIQRITELHSYDTPCVIKWDVSTGNPAFFQWVEGVVV